MRAFRILTVGWDPPFTRHFLAPIAERTGIEFTHGIVGDARRATNIKQTYRESRWVALGKAGRAPLPNPDYELLASLEGDGIPTIRSMVRGDRVLSHRDPVESLAYATLLARRLFDALDEVKPDVVLGSYDSVHAGLGLAVSRARGVPWVALAFTTIPDNRTGFCKGLTPEQLLSVVGDVDDEAVRDEARDLLSRVRSKNVHVPAYRPPESLTQKVRQIVAHGQNLARRIAGRRALGVDRFTFPTVSERATDLARRLLNSLLLPESMMITKPPERPFVFFPLHMAPESSVDTWAPMYQNQLELAVQVALAVPPHVEVVVKLHFSDPDNYSRGQLLRLMQLPGLCIAHPRSPSSAFLERASLVVGITGTANLEAALFGKPVLLFGDSPYQHFPRTERAQRPDELPGQIRRLLNLSPPSDAEIVEAYAAYLARYMPGRINDWARPIDDAEFDRLADCFRALRAYVQTPGNRELWYQRPPFVSEGPQKPLSG